MGLMLLLIWKNTKHGKNMGQSMFRLRKKKSIKAFMKRGVEKVVVIGYWLGCTTTPQFQRSSTHQNQFYERRSKWQWLSITTSVSTKASIIPPPWMATLRPGCFDTTSFPSSSIPIGTSSFQWSLTTNVLLGHLGPQGLNGMLSALPLIRRTCPFHPMIRLARLGNASNHLETLPISSRLAHPDQGCPQQGSRTPTPSVEVGWSLQPPVAFKNQ